VQAAAVVVIIVVLAMAPVILAAVSLAVAHRIVTISVLASLLVPIFVFFPLTAMVIVIRPIAFTICSLCRYKRGESYGKTDPCRYKSEYPSGSLQDSSPSGTRARGAERKQT
jgi:hypothetical protein